jgi:hypothetical protein
MRKCSKCKKHKQEREFGGKTSSYCKPCRKDYRNSPQQRQASRRNHLQSSYGMTEYDYDKLMKYQNNKCAICFSEDEKLFVDHDYETGLVRGLLCNHCNAGLGMFKDEIDNLIRAIAYIGYSSRLTNFKVNPKRTSRHRRNFVDKVE